MCAAAELADVGPVMISFLEYDWYDIKTLR